MSHTTDYRALPDAGVTPPAISFSGVAKTFTQGRTTVAALDPIDLEVERGSFVSLVGPSGCGKSTALNIVAGLLPATAGEVSIEGRRVVEPSRHVGLMFQKAVLLPWRSVTRNIILPVKIQHGNVKEATDRAHQLLAEVGLAGFENAEPRELSGGMQQRVAICRALITDPDVLLLDEPFGALDAITREALNDLLAQICQRTNKTVILVTHDIDEAVYLSDRVLIMSARPGRIARDIRIELEHPRTADTRASKAFAEYVADARHELARMS